MGPGLQWGTAEVHHVAVLWLANCELTYQILPQKAPAGLEIQSLLLSILYTSFDIRQWNINLTSAKELALSNEGFFHLYSEIAI